MTVYVYVGFYGDSAYKLRYDCTFILQLYIRIS